MPLVYPQTIASPKEDDVLMPFAKVKDNKVTIPKKFREALDIKEGDLLKVVLLEDKQIVYTLKTVTDKDKAWDKVFAVTKTQKTIKSLPVP
jgi:AbrB family looped-hinge helix DNA binding protein